jgi:acetyl esterase/lipase
MHSPLTALTREMKSPFIVTNLWKTSLRSGLAFVLATSCFAADKKEDEAHMRPQDMPSDLRVVDNIHYKEAKGQHLWITFFAPLKKTEGPTPLVVYIHGGGWTAGKRYNMIRPQISHVIRDLNKEGITCASIEYRLAVPGVTSVMDSVADCKDALRFIVKNAQKYGIDPDRIALIGESAGGHLVLTTGLGDEKDYPCDHSIPGAPAKVRCIVAYYPRVSFSDPKLLITERFNQEAIDKSMKQVFGDSSKSDPTMLHKLSPVELVQSNSPAIQIIHGDQDTILPVSNATAMRDSAAAKGVEVECIIVKGADHCFDGKEIHPTDAEIEKSTFDFLMKHLGQSKTTNP